MSLRRAAATVPLALCLTLGMLPADARGEERTPVLARSAQSAVLADAGSGRILFAKEPDRPRPIASMTKLMTLYVALKAVAEGKVRLSDPVAVSERAWRTGGSQIWLEPGERLTLGQLLVAIAVGSANDACVAVAEHVAGSVENFVALMNREAARLGMRHTHFANPHGLDAEGHFSTARDLARLARRAIEVPGLLRLTALREDRSLRDGKGGRLWLVNHNRLLVRYPGVDGLKTGYTSGAGYCLVATARRGMTRLVAVVMGEPSSRARFQEVAELFDYGFARWEGVPIVARGERFGPVPVVGGRQRQVYARASRALAVLVPAGEGRRVERRLVLDRERRAPVAVGQVLGRVEARTKGEGRLLGSVALVAETAVPRWTFADLVREVLRDVLRL